MARRRWQKGHLFVESGYWKLRYYEDYIDSAGKLERKLAKPQFLAPVKGPGSLTKKQALARRDEIMADVNLQSHRPQSLVTLAEFVDRKFLPEHVVTLKKSGAKHYTDRLPHILRVLGTFPMREIQPHHIQHILIAMAKAGYSRTMIQHVIRVSHTVFAKAEQWGFLTGRNPAAKLRVPELAKEPEPVNGYTLEEMQKLLAVLSTPLREMFALGCTTSMHGAELAGLRIMHLNLSDEPRQIAGKVVPPNALLVAEGYVLNQRTTPKNKHRRRILPVPSFLRSDLLKLAAGRDPHEPLFVMPGTLDLGKVSPVDTHNVANRILKPLSKRLGFKINWHRVRHTHATWTDEMMMDAQSRMSMMGHWSDQMISRYTHPFEKQRQIAEAIGERLSGTASGTKVQ